jgi:NAD-dependent deacetylase
MWEVSMKHIAELIKESRKTIVLTGAGISTESGIPDFRSQDGLWSGKDPQKIAHRRTVERHNRWETDEEYDARIAIQGITVMRAYIPESEEEYLTRIHEFTEFYRQRIRDGLKHAPNTGHEILAHWQQRGLISTIMTQNVDGYHQLAGADNVIELHGNLNESHCHMCGKKYFYTRYINDELDILCDCEYRGLIRPRIVLFGEGLPECVNDAFKIARGADLILVLGTSLNVGPVNLLPVETSQHGGKVVIINRDSTDFDYLGIAINNRGLGEVLNEINSLLD